VVPPRRPEPGPLEAVRSPRYPPPVQSPATGFRTSPEPFEQSAGTDAGAPRARTSMSRRRPSSVLLVALSLCPACASTDAGEGLAQRVALRDFQGGQDFKLVSETHTDRVDLYSTPRKDASCKVQSDEVMHALIERLEDTGLAKYGKEGRGPSRGGAVVTRSLEVEVAGRARHWLVGTGTLAEERLAFLECMNDFVGVYNITQSFQAIRNTSGTEVFEEIPTQGRGRP